MSEVYQKLWNEFYPKDVFHPQDSRIELINILYNFFKSNEGKGFISKIDLSSSRDVFLDIKEMNDCFPFPDLQEVVVNRPIEFSGSLGIALSRLANERRPYLETPLVIKPSFYNLGKITDFSSIKAGAMGELVSIEGHVVRATSVKPLVMKGGFKCPKCKEKYLIPFEDGSFNPPQVCPTKKCYNKFLEFDRSSIETIDYQTVKLTELDIFDNIRGGQAAQRDESTRIPKTLEVEIRGNLVNTCIPGDVVRIVGIVKAMQQEASRGMKWSSGKAGSSRGFHESGLHSFYILASSIICIKSSGDRKHSSSLLQPLSNEFKSITSTAATQDNVDSSLSSSIVSPIPGLSSFLSNELTWIRELALSDKALYRLLKNFCPSIFGHELVKFGLLLALFSGNVFRPDESSSEKYSLAVRSNIHVLVVGDPGLGKSQMLRFASLASPRGIFVCGNTTTTAGLTVAISRDSTSSNARGDICIEAGALILGDQGVCCIDELDKITCDEHALLEAMEQQNISIAKGGVVTSLRSRTTVLAAANPAGGHYNKRKSICENLKLNAALLSRFDLIFILLDKPDEEHDQMISEHILSSNNNLGGLFSGFPNKRTFQQIETTTDNDNDSERTLLQKLRVHSRNVRDVINIEQIRRYIEYAKAYVHPKLSKEAAKILQKMYLTMRARDITARVNAFPITTRHLESLIRLAQARARIDLREEVTECDAQEVVNLLQESLLDVYTNETGFVDTGKKGGHMTLPKQMKALVQVMNKEAQMRDNNIFSKQDIQMLCNRLKLDKDVDSLIEVMRRECYLLLKGPKLFQLQATSSF